MNMGGCSTRAGGSCLRDVVPSSADCSYQLSGIAVSQYQCFNAACPSACMARSYIRPRVNTAAWERRFILHNTNTIALNNDSNKTQSGGLPERHKAHLSWPPIVNMGCYCFLFPLRFICHCKSYPCKKMFSSPKSFSWGDALELYIVYKRDFCVIANAVRHIDIFLGPSPILYC